MDVLLYFIFMQNSYLGYSISKNAFTFHPHMSPFGWVEIISKTIVIVTFLPRVYVFKEKSQ